MKNPKNLNASLKMKYKRVTELGLVISLMLCITLFQAFKKFEPPDGKQRIPNIHKLKIVDIPQTKSNEKIPPPPKPTVPIPTESEDIPGNETIEPTQWIFTDDPSLSAPPSNDEDSTSRFLAFDKFPEPMGGFAAIQRNLVYPEIARLSGVAGKVIVNVQIDEKGKVINTEILRSLGNNGCDEAAIAAIRSVRWKPAMQRDIPVKVWVSIPIIFELE